MVGGLPAMTPQTQSEGLFPTLEKTALQVVLPSDAGEGQRRALLVCLQGSEQAGCRAKSRACFTLFCMIKACACLWHPGTLLSPRSSSVVAFPPAKLTKPC